MKVVYLLVNRFIVNSFSNRKGVTRIYSIDSVYFKGINIQTKIR